VPTTGPAREWAPSGERLGKPREPGHGPAIDPARAAGRATNHGHSILLAARSREARGSAVSPTRPPSARPGATRARSKRIPDHGRERVAEFTTSEA
jgi:hypothetical protein